MPAYVLRRPPVTEDFVLALMLLLLLVGAVLVLAGVGWLGRQPGFLSGRWRLPTGVASVGLLFLGLVLSVRGGWIIGAPLAVLALLLGLAARARPTREARQARSDGRMSAAEARGLLGVGPEATVTEIRAAHARLIRMNHPDAGGTDGLAAQLNAARDRLLRG